MKVVDIIPKDIAILVELSVENVDALLYGFDHCQIIQDETTDVAKIEYFTKTFFKVLCDLEEKLKDAS